MGTKANEILGSLASDAMRVVFLYVGQGEATFVSAPDGGGGRVSMLIDSNRSTTLNGIDLSAFLADVLPKKRKRDNKDVPVLDAFVNTHPHNDHLCGIKELRESLIIESVWHSGHKPGPDHDGPYQELQALIKQVTDAKGTVIALKGSRSATSFGKAEIHVVSPAQYVSDDIADEKPADRYKRIHEQCAVMRIGYGNDAKKARILITGDSDKTAWKDHITAYHSGGDDKKDTASRIASDILSAAHHGSYTFFKDRDDDPEPYEEHLKAIAPKQVIISAPDQKDSKHSHPDDWAVEKYKKAVGGDDGILHMGSAGNSFIVDIAADGSYSIRSDEGALAEAYGLADDDDGGGGKKVMKSAAVHISRVEQSRPMGKR